MAHKVKDLAVKVGSYQKDGKEKGRYLNVGVILKTDDGGEFILLDRTFNPAGVPNPDGKGTVLISMFAPKTDANQAAASGQPPAPQPQKYSKGSPVNSYPDDEIPF